MKLLILIYLKTKEVFILKKWVITLLQAIAAAIGAILGTNVL